MSKIVLLAINSKFIHTSLSVWSLAAGISQFAKYSHEVKVIEATIHMETAEIAKQIEACTPDIVGISAYIWNSDKLPDLLKILREHLPKVLLVLGGPEATYNAESWIDNGANCVLRVEGEWSLPALLDDFSQNKQIAPISEFCKTSEIPPDPYSDEYFAALGGRLAYLETSRGCPFSCEFCLSGSSEVRFFPIERAKSHLTRLASSGTQTVKLVDRTFNCNPERAYELFKHVIEMETACCFHFEVAADLFDERTLELLATAPPARIQLEIGLQSFFKPALQAVSRKTDIDKAAENIKKLLDAKNIHVHVDLIAGLPFEGLADFQTSFDNAYALGAHNLQLGFLKLLHGSGLREKATDLGLIYDENPPYEIISNPWICKAELDILRQTENALQRTYNSGKLLRSMEYVLNATSLSAFAFYSWLGDAVPNHGMELSDYAYLVYEYCCTLSGVDAAELRDCMVCDWLAAVKGKNLPENLKISDKRLKKVAEIAKNQLGRNLQRCEVAVLSTESRAVFVDANDQDPVTGLYKLYFIQI